MICKYCGKEIEDNAVFCPYCGKNVEEAEVIKEEPVFDGKEKPVEYGTSTTSMDTNKTEEKPVEKKGVDPLVPIIGLVLSISLYVGSFLMIKLDDIFKGYGDWIVFLLLIPLGVIGMILSSLGRHLANKLSHKIMSWVSFGVLLLDYILLFVCLLRFVG